LHELSHHPDVLARILAEQDEVLGGAPPTAEHVDGLHQPELEQAIDETLRLWPPVWIGPRRAEQTFSFEGATVPAGSYVHYSSWATHRLPELFPAPDAFRPERFTREAKAALPKGAFLPFGGGSRICIGKRFGQTNVRTIATMVLQRYDLRTPARRDVPVALEPTLSPKDGMPAVIGERLPVSIEA
jgi:cytochrome P450